LIGTVKWFNRLKRFGFIEPEEGKDVFVHETALTPGTILNEGDRVEFDVVKSEKGPQARNVRKIE